MLEDYEIEKNNLIKGYHWLVFKRINKNFRIHVAGGLTEKECEKWIKKQNKKSCNAKTNK